MIRTGAVLFLLTILPASSQEFYDLLLKGGHVIDPKNGRNQRLDIAITAGRISRIAPSIAAVQSRSVVDVSDYQVTPGLVDLLAYVDADSTPAGVVPDHNTLRFGVTTVVDAGSSGSTTFERFKTDVIDRADVRVLAFLKVDADTAAAAQVIRKHPRTIVGIRAADGTDDAVRRAITAAESTKTIVMANATANGGLRPGDIGTHLYSRGAPSLDSLLASRKKGVLFDVGHGADGLWFRVAAPAIKQGFLPDIISTGIDRNSVMLPRATMTNVMSKFLAMGLTIEQVIERTTINPAKAIRRTDIGSLEEGGVADIAVFQVRNGRFAFLDSGHAKLTADRELRCLMTVRNGKVVWDADGLSLTDWKNAGPYSNFK